MIKFRLLRTISDVAIEHVAVVQDDDRRPGLREALSEPTDQRGGLLVVVLHQGDLVAAADCFAGVFLRLYFPLCYSQEGRPCCLAVAGSTW